MTQYKIQVGSWTKLPNGKVQEDTRDIMEMMAAKVGIGVESYKVKAGEWRRYLGIAFKEVCIFNKTETHSVPIPDSLFIPYEELQKMLNTPVEAPKLQSLLNTKLDCRKPDGTVDNELSRAFQEACFEQGIKWCGKYAEVIHVEEPFLYAEEEEEGCLYYTDDGSFKYFENHPNKQINFKYSRTLTWEATEVPTKVEPVTPEPVDEMVDICGVGYSAKELSEALALIKAARKG